ncbi:hypothetical protein [Maribacter sp.]
MVNKANKTIRARKEKLRMGIIFALALAFILISCQQKTFDTKEELMAYVSDINNGYTQHKSVNGTDFSITYRPTDMLVSQEMTEEMSRAQIDSLRKKYEPYLYFNLSLSKNNQEVLNSFVRDQNKFGAMVNQLAFTMGDKVHLISKSKDSVKLADYIYPRLYGTSGLTSILFIYPRDKKVINDDYFHFTIEDFGLSTGEISFKIPTYPVRSEPSLKF